MANSVNADSDIISPSGGRGVLRISLDRLGLRLIGRSFVQAMERPRDTGKAEAAQIVAAEFSDSTLPAILSTAVITVRGYNFGDVRPRAASTVAYPGVPRGLGSLRSRESRRRSPSPAGPKTAMTSCGEPPDESRRSSIVTIMA
jgi:hypothetical protein